MNWLKFISYLFEFAGLYFFSWRLKFQFLSKDLSQKEQTNFLVSFEWMNLICSFRLSTLEKFLPQKSQVFGLCSIWVTCICRFKCCFKLLKTFSHWVHFWSCTSPWLRFMWVSRYRRTVNILSQNWQSYWYLGFFMSSSSLLSLVT